MRVARWLLLIGAAALLPGIACKPALSKAPADEPVLRDVSADRFGVAGATQGRGSSRLLGELGVGWIRIPVNWAQVEPRPGVYNWKQVSEAIQAHVRSRPGIKVMVTLRAKSPWAGRPAGRNVRENATLPPRDLDAYYDFVYGMAKRGKGVVQCWQIENEMEGRSWWAGTAEQYVALLHTARRAVRAADPQAKVALGGFTSLMSTIVAFSAEGASREEIARQMGHKGPLPGPEAEAGFRRSAAFMETVLAQAKDDFDVADLHLYHRYQTIPMRVEWLRSRMRAHGYQKPIWCTEMGGPDPRVTGYSEASQAQDVVKRVTLALASGVERVFWLGLTEMKGQGATFNQMGLATRSGQPKPAFQAYRTTIRALEGVDFKSSLDVPGGYGMRFERGSRGVWVLWADGGARFRLAVSAPRVRLTYPDGRQETLAARDGAVELSLSARPVFVEVAGG